jgi:hypothetical protein
MLKPKQTKNGQKSGVDVMTTQFSEMSAYFRQRKKWRFSFELKTISI